MTLISLLSCFIHYTFHIDETLELAYDISSEGPTYGTSTRGPSLANIESASFFHSYLTLFISFIHRLPQIPVIPKMKFKTLIGFMKCNDQEWPNVIIWIWFYLLIVLHKHLQYCSFHYISYFEDGLILSLGNFTLTDIDYVSIMNSSVCPTPTKGGITGQSDPKHTNVHRELNPTRSLYSKYRFKD